MIHSGNVLAFIGDGVLTLQVREHLVAKGITNTKELQEKSVAYVSAKAQATFIRSLLDKEVLTDIELTYFKRGRNAKSHSIAKNTDVNTYRYATGFESLWGYLYLNKETERLDALWKMFIEMVDKS